MKQYFNTQGINTYLNPLTNDGALIHAVNVDSVPFGAKSKRSGYVPFLGTANGSAVQSLWTYKNDATNAFYVYRKSGNVIYYSNGGTGAWTICGNGTVDGTARIGNAVFDTTLIIGDNVGSTRHTTNGTVFTNTDLAPVSNDFAIYQNRAYAKGTGSDVFYSTTNDITNWNTSGTSDSSSFKATGEGVLRSIFKGQDRIVQTKTGGGMLKWDGYSQIDMSTLFGMSSQWSKAQSEDYWFWINQYGHYGYGGGKPQILSNAVQNQFYNNSGSGIAGTILENIQAVCHRYDYIAAIGTVTDDFTKKTISDALLKYDFQKNEYLNWQFSTFPQCFHSFRDPNNTQRLIFGGSDGQVYEVSGTATSDAGNPIASEMIYAFTYDAPEYQKKWNWLRLIFNPGTQITVQVACANGFDLQNLRWQEIASNGSGIYEYRFPSGSNSRIVFVRIYESSTNPPWTYYGCAIDADIDIRK